MDTTQQRIERIYILVHPLCYEPQSGGGEFAAKYAEYIEYEKAVKARWYERIALFSAADILVVCGGPSYFHEDILGKLGRQAMIVCDTIIHDPELWDTLLSSEAKKAIGRDLLAMYWKHQFNWQSDPLGQPIIARGWAERVMRTLQERNMTFDPDTVDAEGWGESFEGCVANYTRFLGTYLGLKKPIEDVFGMTVPDAGFLLRSELIEVVPLTECVRLYIWRAEDGRCIGWYHKALASIGEPSLFARFEVAEMRVEIHSRREILWPSRDSIIEWVDGDLKVPVRGAHYILARNVNAERFCKILSDAELLEEYGLEQGAI